MLTVTEQACQQNILALLRLGMVHAWFGHCMLCSGAPGSEDILLDLKLKTYNQAVLWLRMKPDSNSLSTLRVAPACWPSPYDGTRS